MEQLLHQGRFGKNHEICITSVSLQHTYASSTTSKFKFYTCSRQALPGPERALSSLQKARPSYPDRCSLEPKHLRVLSQQKKGHGLWTSWVTGFILSAAVDKMCKDTQWHADVGGGQCELQVASKRGYASERDIHQARTEDLPQNMIRVLPLAPCRNYSVLVPPCVA